LPTYVTYLRHVHRVLYQLDASIDGEIAGAIRETCRLVETRLAELIARFRLATCQASASAKSRASGVQGRILELAERVPVARGALPLPVPEERRRCFI